MPSTLRQTQNTLEACWCFFFSPGFDDLAEDNQDILDKMIDDLEIYPFVDKNKDYRIFLARFEFAKHGEDFTFPEAVKSSSYGFIDFLGGFPVDCVEMLVGIGEYSTKAEDVYADEGKSVSPRVPKTKLFNWPDKKKVFFNYTAICGKVDGVKLGKYLAKNLDSETKPRGPKWWFRVQIQGKEIKFPIPGEFFGLGVRILPGKYWGHQRSNPFVYAGNWMDTVYYSSGKVVLVNEPTDDRPYYTYTVKWKKEEIEDVRPSDFNIYEVDDRVTLIKDVDTEKTSQLWKDDDMQEGNFLIDKWMIAPVMYYDINNRKEEE